MAKKRLSDFVVIGIIEKPHGIKGDVKVRAVTNYPARFKSLHKVIVEPPAGGIEELEISKIWVRGKVVYLHFKGVDTRDKANAIKGAFLSVKQEDVLPLEEGWFYHFKILGFEVKTISNEILGYVQEVMDLPANAVLVVKNENREYLIPVIRDVVKSMDMDGKEIIIEPMEGLLE